MDPIGRQVWRARGRLTPATVVDHVIPHRGDRKLFWDSSNWQPLCVECHNRDKQREEVHGYDASVGLDGWPLDPRHPSNRQGGVKHSVSRAGLCETFRFTEGEGVGQSLGGRGTGTGRGPSFSLRAGQNRCTGNEQGSPAALRAHLQGFA